MLGRVREVPLDPPPGKAGTVSHLKREMQAAGVKFVTAIHTATFYRWDNRFTADAARDNKDFMVGVCTLNPDDPASAKTLEEYVKSYNVRGLRSVAARSGKLDDPGVEALWETAERLGIVINVLANADKPLPPAAVAILNGETALATPVMTEPPAKK